jgi:hypothetical protein
MKSFPTRYFVFSLALLLVVAALAWSSYRRWVRKDNIQRTSIDWCLDPQDCIVEAVYRYEIQNSEGHKSSDLFFLSVMQDQDPNSGVMKLLTDSSYRVKPISESVNQQSVIRDKVTGEAGVILHVGKIQWIDKDKVKVGLSAYSGFGDAQGYDYELAHGEKGWKVTARKFAYET